MNSHSEVIVNSCCNSIKIISRTGETKMVELPDPKEFSNVTEHWVSELAVDKNDKLYVLRRLKAQTEHGNAKSCALSIFDENYNVMHACLLDFLELRFEAATMVINKNNDIIISKFSDPHVYICDDVGQLKHKFQTATKGLPMLAVSDTNEIITSCSFSEDVKIIHCRRKFEVINETTRKSPNQRCGISSCDETNCSNLEIIRSVMFSSQLLRIRRTGNQNAHL